MSHFNIFVVMLTKRGAEALLLDFMGRGYGVQPAGSAKVPVILNGPAPVVQVTITIPSNDTAETVMDRVKGILKERELGYLFILIRSEKNGISWSDGLVPGEVTPKAAVPGVPDQWGHLTKAED